MGDVTLMISNIPAQFLVQVVVVVLMIDALFGPNTWDVIG